MLRRVITLCGAFVCMLLPARASVADESPAVERARELYAFLVAGEFDQFSAAGDDVMKSKMTPQATAQLWSQVCARLGESEKELGVEEIPTGEYTAVRLTEKFSRGRLKIRFVLNKQQRLSGLWLDGVEPDVPYEAPPYVDRGRFREETLEIGPADAPLPAKLAIPVTRVKHPAVVLVHGSGPHDADESVGANKPFRDLAWGLASQGVAVLRYEKRTHKYPQAKAPGDITLDYEVIDDALAAAKLLMERGDVDPQRVYVLGHSLGALLAPEIVRREPRLAGAILMAAPARPILDVVRDQISYLTRTDPKAIGEKTSENVRKIYQAIDAIEAGRLEDVKDGLLGAPAAYWARVNEVSAVDVVEKLRRPVLIVHGGRDYQVSRADYEIWKERCGGAAHVSIKLYDALNHLMIAGEGPSLPAEYGRPGHVDAEVVRDIAQWVTGVGGAEEAARE